MSSGGSRCTKGHESSDPEYCDVCGAPVVARVAENAPPAVVSPAAGACPSCGEPRGDPSARFCEVCRHDFVSGRPGGPPRAAAPARSAGGWQIVVQADASLDVDPDPATPFVARPDVSVAVQASELLVGREDATRDIHPEIALGDPGASRRHAKIVALPDGGIALQDLASTNGTRVNGVEMKPGSRQALNDGDQITLGRWTRLRLRRTP